MLPLLAIASANVARNLLHSASGQMNKAPEQNAGTDPAVFQKLLQQVTASPEVQKAEFLASEGIIDTTDAERRLADFGARILQDPGVRSAVAGSSGPVEMRFLPDGSVAIKTSDGLQKTVKVEGDANIAAGKALLVVKYLQSGDRPGLGLISAGQDLRGTPQAFGIKVIPGAGAASILF